MRFLTTLLGIISVEKVWSRLNFGICLTCILTAGLLWSSCSKTPSNINSEINQPRIDYIEPTQGETGTHVTIHGGVYSLVTEENEVFFNHRPATVLSGTDSTMIAVVPDGAGSGPVTVRIQDRPGIDSVSFTYVEPAPAITSVSPQTGAAGTIITITGKNFSNAPSEDTVKINGIQADVTTASTTQLTASVPDDATSGSVTVTVNGHTSNGITFNVCFDISSYSAACGIWGDQIRINGCLGSNVSQAVFLDKYPVQPSSMNINKYITVTVPQTTAFADIGQVYPIRVLDTNGNRISGPDFTIISPFTTDSADVQLVPIDITTEYNLTIYGAFTGYSDHFQLVNVYVNGTQITSSANNLIVNETNITAVLPGSLINPDVTNTAEVKIACKSQSVTIKLK